ATCQAGGQAADLGTQRDDRLLALRLDLCLAGVDNAGRLDLGLLTQLSDDRGSLLTRLLTDARSFVPSLGELLVELSQLGVGLGLLRLGSRQSTFDGGGALGVRLLESRHDELLHQHDECDAEDHWEDELDGGREEEVGLPPRGPYDLSLHVQVLLLDSDGYQRVMTSLADHEGEGDTDDGEGLSQGEAQDGDRLETTLRL